MSFLKRLYDTYIIMSSDGLEKCKSVKKDAIEEDFPAYGLIWHKEKLMHLAQKRKSSA